jgi:hypothetical protein
MLDESAWAIWTRQRLTSAVDLSSFAALIGDEGFRARLFGLWMQADDGQRQAGRVFMPCYAHHAYQDADIDYVQYPDSISNEAVRMVQGGKVVCRCCLPDLVAMSYYLLQDLQVWDV